MASPEITATAALIIVSGALGSHPTPAAVRARLTETAAPLGDSADRSLYGAGLLNAAAATVPLSVPTSVAAEEIVVSSTSDVVGTDTARDRRQGRGDPP
jgi:hypothetical protein